jgi:hypothetical protein
MTQTKIPGSIGWCYHASLKYKMIKYLICSYNLICYVKHLSAMCIIPRYYLTCISRGYHKMLFYYVIIQRCQSMLSLDFIIRCYLQILRYLLLLLPDISLRYYNPILKSSEVIIWDDKKYHFYYALKLESLSSRTFKRVGSRNFKFDFTSWDRHIDIIRTYV